MEGERGEAATDVNRTGRKGLKSSLLPEDKEAVWRGSGVGGWWWEVGGERGRKGERKREGGREASGTMEKRMGNMKVDK